MNGFICVALCFLILSIGLACIFIGYAAAIFADATSELLDSIGRYIKFQIQKEI